MTMRNCLTCGAAFKSRKTNNTVAGHTVFCSLECRRPFGTLGDRFWFYVRKTSGCWLWTGATYPDGYGKLRRPGKYGREVRAHRLAYELQVGSIPPGLCVCHRCDNPLCVRPGHLWLGTHGDNTADKMQKGRWRGNSSLDRRAARAVRRAYARLPRGPGGKVINGALAEMAARFGITSRHAGRIGRGEVWAEGAN